MTTDGATTTRRISPTIPAILAAGPRSAMPPAAERTQADIIRNEMLTAPLVLRRKGFLRNRDLYTSLGQALDVDSYLLPAETLNITYGPETADYKAIREAKEAIMLRLDAIIEHSGAYPARSTASEAQLAGHIEAFKGELNAFADLVADLGNKSRPGCAYDILDQNQFDAVEALRSGAHAIANEAGIWTRELRRREGAVGQSGNGQGR
jgi:hypothetical protein